jgi:hypothetical protein
MQGAQPAEVKAYPNKQRLQVVFPFEKAAIPQF